MLQGKEKQFLILSVSELLLDKEIFAEDGNFCVTTVNRIIYIHSFQDSILSK